MAELKFAPREIFEVILEWSVMACFDLILEYRGGVIMVRRKIAPYKNVWALPGLRMYKPEGINDALKRIAYQELGLKINPENAKLHAQYVGKFKTEKDRQDLSTCYIVKVDDKQEITLNSEHFSTFQIANSIPSQTGAMYRYYLQKYWDNK